MIDDILLSLSIWIMKKWFPYIDIYSPKKDKIVSITFSNDKKYINKIERIK